MKKLVASFLIISLTTICQAATITVTNTNNTGAGSLRQAIITANALAGADTIRFDAVTNGLSIGAVSEMNITGSLVIIGNGVLKTKIEDDASGTVFSIGPNINVKIKYLSITNAENGMVRNYSTGSVGDLEVIGCSISGNGAGTGIIYQCSAGTATIDSSQFSALNIGVQIDSYLNVNLRNCFATSCTGSGFAIYEPTNGFITITNNTISNCDNGLSLPEAASGLIANNTVYNISQTGIYIEMNGSIVPSMKFINNTVSNCMTAFGIYEQGSSANAATLSLANNILYNSTYMDFDLYSNDLSGGNPATNANIVGKTSSVYGTPSWYSTSDPLLASGGPQNNGGFSPTIALQNGSPAVNAGNPTGAPAKDQRGYSRNGATDIGAYELNGIIICHNTGISLVTACESYKWIDGITYTSGNNTATYTLKNKAGCDSVVTLNLAILKSTGSTDVKTACDSYRWIDGITYTSGNNTATYTLKNKAGCDSVVTLNLTLHNSSGSTDVKTACDSYRWIDGITYTSGNNTAAYTLKNKAGCDSVVTLNLTILKSTVSTDVKSACGSYKWIDGITYTSGNNTATYTLKNKAGCDSVVTLNLTILKSTGSTDVKSACGSYKWIDGNTYSESNHTATYTFQNSIGCDSIVTLDLTINKVETGIATTGNSITAMAEGALYQWLDCNNNYAVIKGVTTQSFTPTAPGSYAVEITQNNCADTSSCSSILSVGIVENDFEDGLVVYPNPTKGFITVDLGSYFKSVTTKITDVRGQVLGKEKFANSNKLNIEIKGAPGFYFIEVAATGNKKAIVEIFKE